LLLPLLPLLLLLLLLLPPLLSLLVLLLLLWWLLVRASSFTLAPWFVCIRLVLTFSSVCGTSL
jgi:hypothetical protein